MQIVFSEYDYHYSWPLNEWRGVKRKNVFLSKGCQNKLPQTWWLNTTAMPSLPFPKATNLFTGWCSFQRLWETFCTLLLPLLVVVYVSRLQAVCIDLISASFLTWPSLFSLCCSSVCLLSVPVIGYMTSPDNGG